jgi:hypothetical protein
MARKIESRRALTLVLVGIIALIILPIIDRLGIGIANALTLTALSIGVFLFDSRKGNLNNSFLSSLIFMASALTLDNIYSSIYWALPLFEQIFGVIIVAGMFFFIPYIVRWVLRYFEEKPVTLLLTGRTIAIISAISAFLFIYLKSGRTIEFAGYIISICQGWTFWSIFVLCWIGIHLYQLTRNKRNITTNHRFLYNTVALYLLSLIIYIGYIRDFIIFNPI